MAQSHRAVESHMFSDCHLQGWIQFKYLCKCVPELKSDLVPMEWSGLVHYVGKAGDPLAWGSRSAHPEPSQGS